jgi:AsmA protein
MTRHALRGDARLMDRGHRRGRPSRGSRPLWRTVVAYLGLGVLCLAAAAVTFALMAPPLDAVRDRLIRQVHERTGRILTVAGPMVVSLLPRPVVSLQGVGLLPPEGMAGGPTVTVPSVEVEVGFWGLLSRRPKLGQVTLHRPIIDLVVDAHGRRSWDAGPRPKPSAPPPAAASRPAPAVAPAPASEASARPRRLRPLAVRVVGGTVRYRDERSGASYEIGALDLDVTTDAPEAALAAAGAFAWEGAPFRFSASASGESKAAVVVRLAGAPFDITYEGSLAVQGGVAAEGTLSLAHVAYKDVKLGPAKLALSVAAGVGTVTLQDMALYGGRAQGSLTVDASGAAPALSTSLKLTDVSLLLLLKDAAGAAWLDGRTAVALALAGRGTTERQIVESLGGQVQLTVADGTVSGFDVERILRALQRGRLDRLAPRREDRTPFSALTGSFEIAGGVAKTGDLKLVGKHVELQGKGEVELVARRIHATLETKIDGGAPADGAVVSIGTVQLPIAIEGPLDRPEFTIKGQEALSDAIGRIGKNLKSRDVQDAIEGFLGGDRSKRVKPSELLEKLLKKE